MPKNNGDMPIKVQIRRANSTISINSGLFTKVKFTGMEFPASEIAHRSKTARLAKIYSDINELCYRYASRPLKELKAIIEHDIIGQDDGKRKRYNTLADYCAKYASGMKEGTAKVYRQTSDRIREYDDACVDDIDTDWLYGFERHLITERGLSTNGIAQKMRNIRTIINYCRDEGITTNYPFGGRKGYKIKEEETAVNNLTAQEFADLRDYPCEPWQRIYIDMFCLSTYLAGINVGDLLLCKGLTRGRLVFIRRKTDKSNATKIRQISLPVFPEAMEIINKYRGKNYLLNIMDNMTDYHTFTQHWNKALKKIGPSRIVPDKLGKLRKIEYMPLFPSITSYSARYTFACVAANDLDISERTIGMCLGHSWSHNVTSRYITNDQTKIDNAVRRVIDVLNAHAGTYK